MTVKNGGRREGHLTDFAGKHLFPRVGLDVVPAAAAVVQVVPFILVAVTSGC